jgi:hypothetical protein
MASGSQHNTMSAGWAQIPVRKPRPCAFPAERLLDRVGALRLSCTPPCALALTTVSASLPKVTAWAGSRSSTKTRMNTGAPHRPRPSKVARYLTGPRPASTFRRSPSTAPSRSSGRRWPSPRLGACRRDCCASPAVVRRPAAQSLEIGDVLKVMTRTERQWGPREKVHEPHAPTLRVDQNVSSRRRTRPIDAHRESVRIGLKMTRS